VTASIHELTSPDVADRLRATPAAVIPFGSIEQHGPHLPCGTDTMAAELVARDLAERVGALYAPLCPYGVTPIHAGHPGTISLSRATFEALVTEVCRELVAMGVRTLIFVNWHELNRPSLDAVATELQDTLDVRAYVAHACYVAQRVYADDGGSLTHGGSIETLAVLASRPELARLDRADGASRPPGAEEADAGRRSNEVYGFVTDITEVADEGWYGDPGWATPERVETFPRVVVDEIVTRLESIGALKELRS
jgi:creatinine amidohydrolase